MSSLNYCAEGNTRVPGEETIPKPTVDEVIVFEEFFVAGLWMPLQATLMEILLQFLV
jgi:hypothetical protein